MLKLIKLTFLFIILLTDAFESQAQKSKSEKAFEMRDLYILVGMWESNTTITIDTIPHKVTYRMNFRQTADGFGLNMDEAYSDSALGNLRAANLIGFGNDDKKIHWYHVNSMGTTYERVGQWLNSENLRFSYTGKQGEKTYNEVITYAFYGNDEFTYTQIAYLDAKQVKKIFGKFKRRLPTAPKPNK